MTSLPLRLLFSVVIAFGLAAIPSYGQVAWESEIVYFGEDGRLVYVEDEERNRIPDFSHAGYRGGGVEIPDVPVVMTIGPVEGDNTSHIQNSLVEVSRMPEDENGFKGALLLEPGIYPIRGIIRHRFSGVVLRGSGDGDDPETNTILMGEGNVPHQRTILIAGGGISTRWRGEVSGTRRDIVSEFVQVGSREFMVEDATPYNVGDNVVIVHPGSLEWLEAIDFGGHSTGRPWEEDEQTIVFNRWITGINGNDIAIDAPVYNHLDRSLSQSYLYVYNRSGLVTNVGIEDLRIDIETAGGTDENHAWNAIDLTQIEDAWVRNTTLLHFGLSGVRTNTATRITVENTRALDPVARIDGARMYNFNAHLASQNILFKNCHATNGRHHYVSNGTSTTSGVVFLHTTSAGAYAPSEGHRWWSQALLFDNHRELDGPRPGFNPRLLGLYNRGHHGTSHGWSAAHSVAWNCDVAGGDLILQKPPTAQNYAIGCSGGRITGMRPPALFHEPEGYIEGSGREGLHPESLYEAQLAERLTATDVEMPDVPVAFSPAVHVYPNPVRSSAEIVIKGVADGSVRMRILDALGRVLAEEETIVVGMQNARFHANLSSAAAGMYVAEIRQDGQRVVAKPFIVIR